MICEEHNEPLPCKYCKTLEHFDNCPTYKKHNQCTCLLTSKTCKEHGDMAIIKKDGYDFCEECQMPLGLDYLNNTELRETSTKRQCVSCRLIFDTVSELVDHECSKSQITNTERNDKPTMVSENRKSPQVNVGSQLRSSNTERDIIEIPNKQTKELSQTCCRLIAGLIKDVKDTSFTLEETDTHFIHRIELHLKKRGDGN